MKKKEESTNIFTKDDLTPFNAKITRKLRKRERVGNVFTVKKKIIVFTRDNRKIVIKYLYFFRTNRTQKLNKIVCQSFGEI